MQRRRRRFFLDYSRTTNSRKNSEILQLIDSTICNLKTKIYGYM